MEWDAEDPCIDTRTHNELLKRSQLHESDVILTITGTHGVAAVVPQNFGPANINQHSVKLAVGEEISPDYLCVFLNSDLCRPQFNRAATGSSRLALDYPAIRGLRILYPADKAEQQRIAAAAVAKMGIVTRLHQRAESVRQQVPEIPSAPDKKRLL